MRWSSVCAVTRPLWEMPVQSLIRELLDIIAHDKLMTAVLGDG
jgi:hypothetical protein